MVEQGVAIQAASLVGEKMVDDYYNKVLEFLEKNKPLIKTLKGAAKSTGIAGFCTGTGGVLFGPIGAVAGGLFGLLVGYISSDDYDSLVHHVRNMSREEKDKLVGKIKDNFPDLPTAASFVDFVKGTGRKIMRDFLVKFLMKS